MPEVMGQRSGGEAGLVLPATRELASIIEERKQHTCMVNKRRTKTGTKAWLQKDIL